VNPQMAASPSPRLVKSCMIVRQSLEHLRINNIHSTLRNLSGVAVLANLKDNEARSYVVSGFSGYKEK